MGLNCLPESVFKMPEFKDLVSGSHFSASTVFNIVQAWQRADDSRVGYLPTLDEVKSFYDRKFYTDDESLIEEYKKPLIAERRFPSSGDLFASDALNDHFERVIKIFGAANVFRYELEDGTTVIKVAEPLVGSSSNPAPTQPTTSPKVRLTEPSPRDASIFNAPTGSAVSVSYEDKEWKEPLHFFSGGAQGADLTWSETAEKLGIETTHFTGEDYLALPKEERDRVDAEYNEVVNRLGYSNKVEFKDANNPNPKEAAALVRRDMMQADNADAVFAVGTTNPFNNFIYGGTAYAAMRGVVRGLPVYFFDQGTETWKQWNYTTGSFVLATQTPVLTPRAAVIGTEKDFQPSGRRAIREVVENTGRFYELSQPEEEKKSSNITLTKEQQKVVDEATKFILSKIRTGRSHTNKQFLTIQGMAGTGKTTIVRNIVEQLRRSGSPLEIAVSALSRKAVHVLSEKLSGLGVQTETLYTLAGAEVGQSEEKFAINPRKSKLGSYNLIFVDEASMVGPHIMSTIQEYIEEHPNTCIVFLGDYGQVRPIAKDNESSVKSVVFSGDNIQLEGLTERIRQGEGSPILGYADKFYTISVGKSDDDISTIDKSQKKTQVNATGALIFADKMPSIASRMFEAFQIAVKTKNPNYVKVVSSTNARVDALNESIHKKLFPESSEPISEGDLIIFNAPYSLGEDTSIENATEGAITRVGEVGKDSYGVEYQTYDIQLSDGRVITAKKLIRTGQNIRLFNEVVANKLKVAKSASGRESRMAWIDYYGYKDGFADFSLGYAITIHKAQGSTYDMVIVDESHIRTDGAWGNQERAEIMYTALTRSRNITVAVAGVEDSQSVDSFTALNDKINAAKGVSSAPKAQEKKEARPKNRSVRLYIKGKEDKGYFEVVKDFESGYYSVHFKPTDSKNPKAFSEPEKQVLFEAMAQVIPAGGYVSTYGSVSKGGVHGLERLKNLGFVQTGTRVVKSKETGAPIEIPILHKVSKTDIIGPQDPGVPPAGIVGTSSNAKFEEIGNFGLSSRTVRMTLDSKAKTRDTIKEIESEIDNDATDTLPIGTRIVPDTSNASAFLKSLRVLNRVNKNLLRKGKPNASNPLNIDAASADPKMAKLFRRLGIREENGKFIIPTFIVGHSEEDLELKAARTALITQGNFTEVELREYAKRAVFKLSDAITRIQNGETSLLGKDESLLNDAEGNPIDYTKMSRIDILNKIGLGRAFVMFVKRPIFDYAARKDLGFAIKAKVISRNWDAFLELAYDALLNMEEISMLDAKGKTGTLSFEENDETGEFGETLSPETEAELAEIFGSTTEYWQVGFRQISAFHSLSTQIRNTLGKLLALDSNGNTTVDAFGMAQTISSSEAVSKILSWTQHALTIEEMISALNSHIKEEPWLRQLVGKDDTAYTDSNGQQRNGILVDSDFAMFQSEFFTNFRKYFQSYTVTYFDKNGNVQMRAVNSQPFEAESIDALRALVQNGTLTVWDAEKKTTSSAYTRLSEIVGKDAVQATKRDAGRPATGLYAFIDSLEDESIDAADKTKVLKDLYEAYKILDIEVPEESVFEKLFSNGDIVKAINTLGYIVDDIDTAKQTADLAKGEFQLFARKNESIAGVDPETNEITEYEAVNATSNYRTLLRFIAPAMTSSKEVVSYEGGKLYYAYVMPNYLGILCDKLKGYTGEQSYEDFIQEEYLQYEGWFYNSEDRHKRFGPKGHLNYILYRLTDEETGEETRKIFEHVTSLTYDGTAYADKTKAQYYSSMVSMFLYDVHKNRAYYRFPTMSNKPSEEYYKFERLGADVYESTIIDWLAEKTFYQELNRIRTVLDRRENYLKENPDAKISNIDKNGDEFFFLPFLNKYLRGEVEGEEKFSSLLQRMVEQKGFNFRSKDAKRFVDDLKRIIKTELDGKFEEFLDDAERTQFITRNADGEITGIYQIDDKFTMDDYQSDDYRKQILREYFWNDFFASVNMLQLTVSDIALYSNAEDLQKRLAQLHAPGMRPNIHALDITTKERISDGKSRYVILKDNKIKSNIIENLRVALSRSLARYKGVDRTSIRNKYENIIKMFEDSKAINFADAQAFSSPTSYRKKMHLFGKWNQAQEDAYQKVISGNYTEDDLDVIWQPLKPFVYAQIGKDSHSEYMPKFKIGVQNKNSEYLLLMADALMRAEGVESTLGAIYDVMEASQGTWVDGKFVQNTKGIDTFMFESAVKTGGMGIINLNDKSPQEIKTLLWDGTDEAGGILKDSNDEDGYNQIYVHTIPFDCYVIQQEVPPHLKGRQQMGSQARIHTIADLPDFGADGKESKVTIKKEEIDDNGNTKIVDEEVTVKDLKERYQKAVAENIELSYNQLAKELGLTMRSKKLRNIALSNILKREILKDGRFGSDLLWACDTNENGEFNIPLSDPIQSGRIQQLLNSLIKNRINKQEVLGGALVQVSSWGLSKSKELNIRFQDASGKLLYTRKEFDAIKAGQTVETPFTKKEYVSIDSYQSGEFEKYLNDNQSRVAYMEAYVSIYDDELLNYQDENGVIDVRKIEKENPKLLEMIGYRIPTEAKYSMVPIKIVGFLPRSGEGIMLPAEITLLTGSDFDVDKLYILRRAFTQRKNLRSFISERVKSMQSSQEMSKEEVKKAREKIASLVNAEISDVAEEDMDLYEDIQSSWNSYKQYSGLTTQVSDAIDRNNNEIIDMIQAVLTSPDTADQVFSPGNFNEPKRVGYLIAAYDNLMSMSYTELLQTVKDVFGDTVRIRSEIPKETIMEMILPKLSTMDTMALKNLSYKAVSLLYAHTQAKFHQQNSVAGKLIGVFAQANVSHGFITLMDNAELNISADDGFVIDQHEIFNTKGEGGAAKYVKIDRLYSLDRQTRISEVLASLLASSVDAVKDPVLNLFNINMTTVNIVVTMARLGFPLETIGWFLTTPILKELTTRFEQENVESPKSLERVTREMMQEIQDRNNGTLRYFANKNITTQDLIAWHTRKSEEELAELSGESPLSPEEEEGRFLEELHSTMDNESGDGVLNTQDKIDYQLLGMTYKMLAMADAFRSITHMTRYNSIASAVGPFIANTYVSKASDVNFLRSPIIGRDMTKVTPYTDAATGFAYTANDFKRQILENPILSGFRKFAYFLEGGHDNVRGLLSDNFIQGGVFGRAVFDAATRRFERLSTNVAQSLSEFMLSYAMNSIAGYTIFDVSDAEDAEGNFDKENTRRFRILQEVPAEVSKAKIDHPDNKFLQAIRKSVNQETGEINIFINTRGRDETDLQDIKTGWTELYRTEATRIENEGGSANDNLALRIVEYNFFRGGFGFSPKTFMRLVPSEVKKVLPNYISNLNEQYREMNTDKLLDQFMLNLGITNMPVFEVKDIAAVSGMTIKEFLESEDTITIYGEYDDLTDGVAKIKLPNNTIRWAVIRQIGRGEDTRYALHFADKLGGSANQGFEINPMKEAWEIHTVFNSEASETASRSAKQGDESGGRALLRPIGVSSYSQFEMAIMNMMAPQVYKKFAARNNFNEKIQILRNFANSVSEDQGSEAFNRIKRLLNSLQLTTITEDSLNNKLDELNICR